MQHAENKPGVAMIGRQEAQPGPRIMAAKRNRRRDRPESRNTQGQAYVTPAPESCLAAELAHEGEVVVATGRIGNAGAAVNCNAQARGVHAIATVHVRIRTVGVANSDRAADIAAAVDVASRNGATITSSGGDTTITSARGIDELHFENPPRT